MFVEGHHYMLLIVMAGAAIFGFAVLGEVVGLWEFDTGLGCENGDKRCR